MLSKPFIRKTLEYEIMTRYVILTLHLQSGVKMGVTLRVYILAYRALTCKTRLHPEHQDALQSEVQSDHHYALC